MIAEQDRLNPMHLELLKGIRHLNSEEQVKEVRQLLNLYFRGKLDAAIEHEENGRDYVDSVYEQWLTAKDR